MADREKVMPVIMNEQIYLFVFDDDTTYEMNCGISLKDAVWEMSKYTGNASELFLKALRGFEENDVDGIVALFNRFFYYSIIKSVYIVREKIFPKKLLKGEDDA